MKNMKNNIDLLNKVLLSLCCLLMMPAFFVQAATTENNATLMKAAEKGMDVFRIFDALNDIRNLKTAIQVTKKAGKHAQGTICYTTSPVHNITSFVTLGKELAALGCETLDLGRVPDQLEATMATLTAAAGQADLVMGSGGVSVGVRARVGQLGPKTMGK